MFLCNKLLAMKYMSVQVRTNVNQSVYMEPLSLLLTTEKSFGFQYSKRKLNSTNLAKTNALAANCKNRNLGI